MTTKRRVFVLLIFVVALAAISFSGAAQTSSSGSHYLALVGTYTSKTQSKGIYAYDFDAATGKLTPNGLAAETRDPSFLAVHPSGKYVYAVNETGKQSEVSAFQMEARTGRLKLLNHLSAFGEDPCYISLDRSGRYVLIANYTSGNIAVFPILEGGRLGEHTALLQDPGATGPNKQRQEGPHAHWIEPSAHNHFVYVADLGLDRVLVYRFDDAKGTVTAGAERSVGTAPATQHSDPFSAVLSPGTGPRHLAFSRDGDFMYVLGELNSTVTVFANEAKENFRKIQQISILPAGFSGRNDAAEIAIHPNGKFLYAANRGHDSIAVFAIEPKKGTLTQVSDVATGGMEPRHFAIDPTGRYLLAENQNSDTIVEFRIDPANGTLTPSGEVVHVPSPVCLIFTPIL